MIASAEAQELEEVLVRVEASVGDLIGAEKAEALAGRTWDFGPSLMTKRMILQLKKDECIPQGRTKLP